MEFSYIGIPTVIMWNKYFVLVTTYYNEKQNNIHRPTPKSDLGIGVSRAAYLYTDPLPPE